MSTDELKIKGHKFHSFFHGDAVIWIVFILLCAISVIEIYSASSSLSYRDGHYWIPVIKHSGFLLTGFLIVFLVHNIPYKYFRFYPIFFMPLSFFLLAIVLISGKAVNGAARGIPIFGINIQPSEIAKGAVMIAVAVILSATQSPKGADKHAFKYIMWATLPICALIAPENLSTAGILFLTVFLMMWVGHVPAIQLGKLFSCCLILGLLAGAIVCISPEEFLNKVPKGHRITTWKHRIQNYFVDDKSKTKVTEPDDFDLKDHAQEAHSQIAIATSNFVGKMPGNSIQRDFLYQAYSDFIYAIIIEELGIVGGGFVALLYIILLFRAGKIARQCERNFPAFLVIGLTLLIVVQALINMAVAVGLIPVTGQPLPLISRGGASILVNSVYIGMILSVSRFAKKKEANSNANVEAAPVVQEIPEQKVVEES